MTEKRFADDGIEDIENQSFTDNLTGKTYWIDNGLDEIVNLLNDFNDENERLKKDRFICLDCEHSGYTEIGCLCEYTDHWQEYIIECEDFKELRE